MLRKLFRFALLASFLCIAFYNLRGETEIPDLVLQSVHLLKKPIEDLLPDIQDDLTSQAVQQTTLELESYQELRNERERWNEMRQLIESGQPLVGPLPSEIAVSTNPIGRLAPAIPPPPGFTVQMPYESRLTVSGRKTIGMTYRSTQFSNSGYANTQGLASGQSQFELQQSLQVRINGQIGRKVTVNVDFDDTKPDKKDISIVYKGDPDELVQRAAFGDINLSLPQTEFAGYSKQVFGVAAELKYKALRGYFIGSRTKGETETKEFVGNVILQRQNVPDTSYIRHRFYNYTLLTGASGDKPIDLNTLKVYLDTRDSTRLPQQLQYSSITVDLTQIPNRPSTAETSYTGLFQQLAMGIDYSVDPSSGVITFKNALTNTSVVAIDYMKPGTNTLISQDPGRGTIGQRKAIKWDETLITVIPGTEELTHYTVGNVKIVRDNGQGNFTLQLRDLGNTNIGPTLGIQYLPNSSGQIVFDFEAGTFALTKRLDTANAAFASVYNFTPTTQSSFFLEFRSRVKTYTLRPNIVLNSERITMNGRVLVRDVDYFIDYDSGFITFFNEDQITETSRIQATYDFSPFGVSGAQQDTLVGTRAEVSLSPVAPIFATSLLGTTVIYDFAPKQTAAPDIRQTSGSWLVNEADLHLKDLIFNPLPMLKSSFTGEVARSVRNPNTFGKALIDNMEGVKDETSVSLSKLSWQIAANPSFATRVTYLNAIGQVNLVNQAGDNLTNDRVPTLEINPNASALSGDQTQVLNITYDLTRSTEASIATVLSPIGVDLSKKQYLEMWIQGDGSKAGGTPSGTQLNVTLGQIKEDFDATGSLKTEDANHNNTLDVGEDIGIPFRNPDDSVVTLGAGNFRIDSNDSDRNGILETTDNTLVGGNFGYSATLLPAPLRPIDFTSGSTPASSVNAVDFSGWKFVRVPLDISSTTAANWSAIKEMRLSLNRNGPTGTTGTIRIAKIAVVGNHWEAQPSSSLVVTSTITVKAVNTEDDAPRYVSPAGNPDFDDLNQINTALTGPTPSNRREQSLALEYGFSAAGSTVTAKSVTVSPMDFTQYGSLRFFVRKPSIRSDGSTITSNQQTTFIFRVGSDTDYLEFDYPIDNLQPDVWTELRINQLGSPRPSIWASGTAGGTITSQGSPNLSSVAQMSYGIGSANANPAALPINGEVWIDELHAGDVLSRTGYAKLFKSDFELYGWGTFGMGLRDIDRNFETFTSAITNQDRRNENAYLTLSRLTWFPMHFTGSRSRTITPSINTVNSTLVSFQQEGVVEEKAFSGSGTLQIPRAPRFSLSYSSAKTDSQQLFRVDRRDDYGVTMDYAVPSQRAFLPRNVQLGYKLSKLRLDFGSGAFANATDPFSLSNTRDSTVDLSARMSFQPLAGFSFNPNFSRSSAREAKDVVFSTQVARSTVTLEYDKLKTQTMGFDGVMAFKKWLAPRLRYSITNRETYGIPTIFDPLASAVKTVDRTATGESSWDFAWRDFSARLRPLQSLNVVSSYIMEDGDTWDNVDAGYSSLNTFSVRKSLGHGRRTNQTLRDTLRSTQRWLPFDWATTWTGSRLPWRTLSLTSTYSNTKQRQETTQTPTRINTVIFPDIVATLTQTEYFFYAQNWMSNSQMNIKTQYKKVDTVNTSLQKSSMNGGDWRFTIRRKLDLFFTFTRTTDNTFDRISNVTTNKSIGETLGAQMGFNVGKWRFSPKYDQSKQQSEDSAGRLSADQRTRTMALQVYADLFLPAGMKLPFGDLMIFSNRIRTTDTFSLEQRRSSLDELHSNIDTYRFSTSNDYEMTSNVRLSFGGSYFYMANKVDSAANTYGYEINSLLTIQF